MVTFDVVLVTVVQVGMVVVGSISFGQGGSCDICDRSGDLMFGSSRRSRIVRHYLALFVMEGRIMFRDWVVLRVYLWEACTASWRDHNSIYHVPEIKVKR